MHEAGEEDPHFLSCMVPHPLHEMHVWACSAMLACARAGCMPCRPGTGCFPTIGSLPTLQVPVCMHALHNISLREQGGGSANFSVLRPRVVGFRRSCGVAHQLDLIVCACFIHMITSRPEKPQSARTSLYHHTVCLVRHWKACQQRVSWHNCHLHVWQCTMAFPSFPFSQKKSKHMASSMTCGLPCCCGCGCLRSGHVCPSPFRQHR